jgi:hypothetical protein
MDQSRGVTDVLSELMGEITTLFRNELQLVRTEMSEKFSLLGTSIAMIVASGVLFMATLVLLLEVAVAALVERGISLTTATLSVAGVVLLVGIVLLWIGLKQLNVKNVTPTKTVDRLQSDAAMAIEHVAPPIIPGATVGEDLRKTSGRLSHEG